MAKNKMTPQEKKARAEQLANETIEQRTVRVLNPRINRLRKSMKDLTKSFNSPRYKIGDVQKEKLVSALSEDYTLLINAIEGSKSTTEQIKDIL